VKLRRQLRADFLALAPGLTIASGEFILAMIGDCNTTPTIFPAFLEKLEGYDVVSAGARTGSTTSFCADSINLRQLADGRLSGVNITTSAPHSRPIRREVIQNIPSMARCTASFPAASCMARRSARFHQEHSTARRARAATGIGRTFRVFFDLLTIRFLLKYMSRPVHFFGGFGALGILAGSIISAVLLGMKVIEPHRQPDGSATVHVCDSAAVHDCGRIQMLAIGMLGELQVRHYSPAKHPSPYTIDRLVRLSSPEEQPAFRRARRRV